MPMITAQVDEKLGEKSLRGQNFIKANQCCGGSRPVTDTDNFTDSNRAKLRSALTPH